MQKMVHASNVIDQAIEELSTLKKSLKGFGGLSVIAPTNEPDFVVWFIDGLRAFGVKELTGLQLEQAAKTFGIQLTQKGGYWIRSCGYEKNRTKSGLRWYDIQSIALPDQGTAPTPDFQNWGQ